MENILSESNAVVGIQSLFSESNQSLQRSCACFQSSSSVRDKARLKHIMKYAASKDRLNPTSPHLKQK